jgi:uncharacterized membrane protein required for colicin V production
MGLDVALGILVLIAGIRGWLRGFIRQAIPLAALVGCVYAASPLRDLARPHAREYFPSIGHEVLDRMLWWTAGVLSYVLMTGVCFSIVKAMRKRTYGDPEPNRADQGAGFTLGVAKGLIVASCLATALRSYGPNVYNQAPALEKQAEKSRAMEWSEKYRPAETLWNSTPVQKFVAVVKSEGMGTKVEEIPAKTAKDAEPATVEKPKKESRNPAEPAIRTASEKARTLSLPDLDPLSPEFDKAMEEALRREGLRP